MEWIPRQYPRFKASLPVELRPVGLPIPLRAHTGDISLGGLYVELVLTQHVSTEVDITLWIEEGKIRAQGVVVSNHPAFGNGIKFTRLPEEDKVKLKSFLDSLALQPRNAQAASSSSKLRPLYS